MIHAAPKTGDRKRVGESAPADDAPARILQAAGPIFAEKGFDRATIREISQAAHVNLAAVNYHFGDKERLYIEAVKLAHRLRVAHAPLPEWPAGMRPAEKLRVFVRNLLSRMLEVSDAQWQTRLMMREILSPTSACRELVQDYFRPHFERLLAILDEMLPAEFPDHRRRMIGFSIIGQCVYYRVAGEVVALLIDEQDRRDHFTIDHLARHIAEFSLAALQAGDAIGSRHAVSGSDEAEQGPVAPSPDARLNE